MASLKLTPLAMLVLVVTALLTYRNPALSINWVVLPLLLLSLNLVSAILTNRRFRRQSGLMLFHLGLLVIIVLAGLGIMFAMEGRIELTEGEAFDPAAVEIIHRGRWHHLRLHEINFIQGPVQVDFVSAQRRGNTRSQVWLLDDSGQRQPALVGDRQSLQLAGYRFITTGNKGYSVILTWTGEDGLQTSGAVNMPSYPVFEWRQRNDWTTPAGQPLSLSLQVNDAERTGEPRPWTLDGRDVHAQLAIGIAGQQRVLKPGQSIQLEKGLLRFEEVRVWMGYRLDYNVMLAWQFLAALIAIIGLAMHFWQKLGRKSLNLAVPGRDELGRSAHV